jgi:hypothetical protein
MSPMSQIRIYSLTPVTSGDTVLGKYGSGILDKELDANQTKRFGDAAVPWSSQALA